jgi:hypothetical protein
MKTERHIKIQPVTNILIISLTLRLMPVHEPGGYTFEFNFYGYRFNINLGRIRVCQYHLKEKPASSAGAVDT